MRDFLKSPSAIALQMFFGCLVASAGYLEMSLSRPHSRSLPAIAVALFGIAVTITAGLHLSSGIKSGRWNDDELHHLRIAMRSRFWVALWLIAIAMYLSCLFVWPRYQGICFTALLWSSTINLMGSIARTPDGPKPAAKST